MKRDASEVIEAMLQDRGDLLVTVSNVTVSDDLRYAKIYYTVLGDEEKRDQAEKIFSRSSKFIQTELAHRMRIRRMPEITMQYDDSLVEGMRMVNLIDDIMAKTEEENDGPDQT